VPVQVGNVPTYSMPQRKEENKYVWLTELYYKRIIDINDEKNNHKLNTAKWNWYYDYLSLNWYISYLIIKQSTS